jgi:hypothetical protein
MDAAATLITSGIMLGEKPAVLSAIVKYHCTHRGQRAIIDFAAAFISSSTHGWQRIAPWPKIIMLRVRMFAPSTVMADHQRHYAGRKTGGAVSDCKIPLHPSRPARHH